MDQRLSQSTIELDGERNELVRRPLPEHVGVIMDGNGRWAQARGMSREEGHRQGAANLRAVVEECIKLGIPNLSTFAFSTENWLRPPEEVEALMVLMAEFSISQADEMVEQKVRVVPIGDLASLPGRTRREIQTLADRTRDGDALTLMVAINYGGRADILQAVRGLCSEVADGSLDPGDIDAELFRSRLYTHPQPDPDLIIRTGGEWRLSNFFLYQAAYSELYSTDVLWPDFGARELHRALRVFQKRERRFGGLKQKYGDDPNRGGDGE